MLSLETDRIECSRWNPRMINIRSFLRILIQPRFVIDNLMISTSMDNGDGDDGGGKRIMSSTTLVANHCEEVDDASESCRK